MSTPRRYHLDRRAEQLIAQAAGDGDQLLTTPELADWLGVSHEWLKIGRLKKHRYGPKFIKLSPQMVRYKRSDVVEWLESRRQSAA